MEQNKDLGNRLCFTTWHITKKELKIIVKWKDYLIRMNEQLIVHINWILKLDSYFSSYTKINSTWIKNLEIKGETLRPQNKIKNNIYVLNLRQ